MNKIKNIFLVGTVMLASSCSKYLDINNDPNNASASSATPELLLPQAITYTAGTLNTLNTLGSQLVGYAANAGGYGGFGVSITYNFSTDYFAGIWSSVYDNNEDFQAIIDKTDGNASYVYFNAAARIMKTLNFQLLVDQYNDVPYSEALKGSAELTPVYDDAKTVYKSLVAELDKAIADINTGIASASAVSMGNTDVLFKGEMTSWKKLANTIKLRLIIRGSGKVDFGTTSFEASGFLTSDALINPGYQRLSGKQNPKWNTWAFDYAGNDGNKAWMPNTFIMSYYDGKKLSDPYRGAAIYYPGSGLADKFPNTPTNRLGVEGTTVQPSLGGSFWYPAKGALQPSGSFTRTGSSAGDTTGVLKGPNAGMPVITAAESYFLQAEAAMKGLISGNTKSLFESGITASFKYIYSKPDNTISGDYAGDVTKYLAENDEKYLVKFDLATTNEQKLEAIITQKYIALNFVNSDEAWNEYRRTQYPTIAKTVTTDGTATFASSVSESSRADKLPARILYPTSEGATNTANLPKGVSVFNSLIFWAK